MEGSEVLLSREEGGVAVLRLNRPEARNALNLAARRLLADFIGQLDADPSVKCVVIAGDDRAFAAGADVGLLADKDPLGVADLGLHKLWQPLQSFSKPLIAAVAGVALGAGCELALQCDIIVAANGARFGLPEVRLGIMPGAGGTQRLVRAVGKFAALRMLLTGEAITAQRAFELGLVMDLTEDPDPLPKALELARSIAAMPGLAVAHIKEAVLSGADLPLGEALAFERRLFQLLFASHDQKEGMAAFLEKRPPRFEDR